MNDKFNKALNLFDQANSADPHIVISEGKEFPKELLYAIRMTQKMNEFEPNASVEVQLAARCQHICRWEISRDSYPMNRKGYLSWRRDLAKFHANKASGILKEVGYDTFVIEKVAFLLQKKQLKKNEDTQLLEDIICLVFLENYFENFSEKYSENKLIDILQKTWSKMSDKGRDWAMKINYSEKALILIKEAIS